MDEFGLCSVDQFEQRLKELSVINTPVAFSAVSTHFQTPQHRSVMAPTPQPQDQFLDIFTNKIDLILKHEDANAEKTAQEMGIQYHKLTQMKSPQEKEDFVIKQLIFQVQDQLKEHTEKTKAHYKMQQQTNQPKESKGIFEWLEIQSKFVSLKEKLKFALVEVMNDQANREYVQTYMKGHHRRGSAIIPNYPSPDTRAIIDELTNLLKSLKVKKPEAHRQNSMSNLDVLKDTLKWDQSREDAFRQSRSQAKVVNSKQIKSTSWNQVACQDFVREAYTKTRSTLQRDELLNSYMDGNLLSAQEYQYLANTSDLLNKCCDKNYLQQAVLALDENIINDIELFIAENILKQYYNTLHFTQQQRHEWLSRKTSLVKHQNHRKSQSIDAMAKTKENGERLRRIKSKIVRLLRNLAKERQARENEEYKRNQFLKKQKSSGNLLANPYVWRFKEKMMAIVNKRRKLNKGTLSEDFLNRQRLMGHQEKILFKSKNNTYTVSQVRQIFHPSSKLVVKPDLNDQQLKKRDFSLVLQEAKATKLSIKNPEPNIKAFNQFYTGGPFRQRPTKVFKHLHRDDSDDDRPYKGEWITHEIEVAAANKIKSAMRQFLERKKYRKLKEKKDQLKARQIENRIKRYLSAKALVEYAARSKEMSPNTVGTKLTPEFEQFKNQMKSLSRRTSVKNMNETPKFTKKVEEVQKEKKYPKVPQNMKDLPLKQRKLFYAIKVGNKQLVETSGFIYYENDVNCYDTEGNTPLYYASLSGDHDFCLFLIASGADVNMPSKNQNTPLHAAFKSNNVILINLILQSDGDLNATNSLGHTPVHYGKDSTIAELNLGGIVASRQTKVTDNNLVNRAKPVKQIDDLWNKGVGEFNHERLTSVNEAPIKGRPKSFKPGKKVQQ